MEGEHGESALRQLALRMLSSVMEPMYSSEATDLLVGRLPDGLPVEIPVLDDSHIVGSLVRVDDGHSGCTVLLGSNVSPDEVLDNYDAKLKSLRWSRPEPPMHTTMHGGFTTDMWARTLGYCWSEDGPQLQVNAYRIADGSTEIRLILNSDPRYTSFCRRSEDEDDFAGMRHARFEQIIPELKPPKSSAQMSMGGGGGTDHWNSNATLDTDLDLQSVSAHYDGQLQEGGWTRTSSGEAGRVSFSTWDVQDKKGQAWVGLFVVIENPPAQQDREHSYVLSVHAFNPDQLDLRKRRRSGR